MRIAVERCVGVGGGGGCFFFQAEDGIRDIGVTGVQTCALPISFLSSSSASSSLVSPSESLKLHTKISSSNSLASASKVSSFPHRFL